MSIVALEPPVLTTETTCVALPTAFANQGVPAAALDGATANDTKPMPAAVHSRATSRRMESIVRCGHPAGQVKLQDRLGHYGVINELRVASSSSISRPVPCRVARPGRHMTAEKTQTTP